MAKPLLRPLKRNHRQDHQNHHQDHQHHYQNPLRVYPLGVYSPPNPWRSCACIRATAPRLLRFSASCDYLSIHDNAQKAMQSQKHREDTCPRIGKSEDMTGGIIKLYMANFFFHVAKIRTKTSRLLHLRALACGPSPNGPSPSGPSPSGPSPSGPSPSGPSPAGPRPRTLANPSSSHPAKCFLAHTCCAPNTANVSAGLRRAQQT